ETRVVRWSDLLPERCFAIQLDLSHEVGRVAITRTIVPPNCAAQGMTSTKLRSGAEAVLGDLGERVYKLQAWRNTVNDFGSALGELRPGRRFGASVGRFDSGDSLLANAAEAVRQGSRELIQLELSCSGDAPDRTDYTLHATRIDIVPLAETYDDVAGRDVDGDVSLISDVVHGQAELEGLLVRVLARLQGKPYIWTQPDNRLRRLQGATNERVSVYVPSDHEEEVKVKVTLDSYRLLSQEEYVCRKPDGSPGLSTQAVAKSFWGTRTPVRGHKIEQLRVSPGTESTSTMDWNPYGGGLYLLRVQATFADRSSVNTTFRCVEVQNQDAYVWFNLSYQRGLGPTPARAARDDSVSYGRLLLGMARATAYDGSFNFGVTAGYGNAVYSRSTPTAWELTPATGGVSPVPTGPVALPINWTRQSLLFGPAISVRWSGPLCQLLWGWTCTRPLRSIDLVARALPLLDIGIVNTSSVDPQLRRMLDGRDGLDLDLSASLEAGVMVHLGPTLSLELQGNVGVLGWDDLAMGGRDQSEAQSSITYDAHFIAGGSMGMLWGF
ncbi:MAG TPA: hypothetical protein VHP33_21915, partial [Polyangiaceae bacterium]|nr:hypothetical protein [Polyangiaceae bacterium]